MERLMLLDGNGLIYRGYFALPPLTTSRGELVNAVFGFCLGCEMYLLIKRLTGPRVVPVGTD